MTTEYAVRGTYWDGVQRHHHVTTDDIREYAASLLVGFLPFDKVEVEPCTEGIFHCTGHTWSPSGGHPCDVVMLLNNLILALHLHRQGC